MCIVSPFGHDSGLAIGLSASQRFHDPIDKMKTRMASAHFGFLAVALGALVSVEAAGQGKSYPLTDANGLRLHFVVARPGTLNGKNGLQLTQDPDTARELASRRPGQADPDLIAVVGGLDFTNGVIEAEVAGTPGGVGTFAAARGFVGIAFRVHDDDHQYDAFYLRPTNGRSEDQERRNHATQYISHPDWPWSRLRRETPSRYEAYVDLVPNEWTKIKIVVHGDQARLYVHDRDQPTLVVNDVKTGATGHGSVALWIGPGTVGYFRNLVVTPEK